ncbi:DUF262 domain-containing protein [Rhodococcus pseudokoreensis]|uniref:DUF262 domain-containing protein n=1 Tax=Rhodococcus pseudokoreensis TaxID=2811421 RepID=A0A974W9M1_9NOCA|nr:DUF262 domain-containing protein [Rhodococcus pseudokoreensis]QSE93709.1 DUF262 domain-containing protein [Rhodococcus pseudokoreensis]
MAEIDAQPKSIQILYDWYVSGKLLVNRRYQRKLVWTLEEKRELIESIRNNYPIPSILLAEMPGGRYEIIDGLQRLFSIFSFIETSYSTSDEKYFDVDEFPSAKRRSNEVVFENFEALDRVSREEVVTILGYSVPISIMRSTTESEINEVFRRINTYGRQLSDQERRQSGVQDPFSNMIRKIASSIRGDTSDDLLPLEKMPEISVDLPKTQHGYGIQADQTFWVSEGILLSTDLRDSKDEQCLADIAACIVGGQLIERSKDALDQIYSIESPENERIKSALSFYGEERLKEEIDHCINEIRTVTAFGTSTKMRNLLFSKRSNNGFPALFTTIVIAIHQVLINKKRKISDYGQLKKGLENLDKRVETGRGSTTVDERKKNISAIVGLLEPHTVEADISYVYSNHSAVDIDNIIQRSVVESSGYELKQGLLTLSPRNRCIDPGIIEKVAKNICAIANNGPSHDGTIIIGIADKKEDAQQVEKIDAVRAREVGQKYVVGVSREAKFLGKSPEEYFTLWKNGIRDSALSDPLKADVLSSFTWNNYYGYGLIVVIVPKQKAISFYGDYPYIRSGDELLEVRIPREIADVSSRFSK